MGYFSERMFRYFLLPVLVGCAPAMPSAQVPYTVEQMDKADGLPSQKIRAVAQDRQGLMWFAAYGVGLIRFDGWNYTVLQTGPESRPSLSSNYLVDILLDKRGLLWLANENGIEVLDPVSMEVRTAPLPFSSSLELAHVLSLHADTAGNVWATSMRDGLLCFADANPDAGRLVEKRTGIYYANRAADGRIWCFAEDDRRIMRQEGTGFLPGDYLPSLDEVQGLVPVEDTNGLLTGVVALLAKKRKKFYRLDPASERFVPGIGHNAVTTFSLMDFIRKAPPNSILPKLYDKQLRVFRDRKGLIWVSTMEIGIFKLKPRELVFSTCPDLQGVSLRGMLESADGSVYVCSYNGLHRFFPATNQARLLSGTWNAGFHLAAERGDTLLICMDGGGLRFFDRRTRKLSNFNPRPDLTGDEGYYASLKNADGSLLAGNRRLFRLFPQDWSVHPICALPTDQPIRTFAFTRTRDGDTWIGTDQGAFVLRANGVCDTPALRRDYRLGSQSQINDIFEDRAGRLWFATRSYGVMRYDPASGQYKAFDLQNGFASRETYKIWSNPQGDLLWVSTSAGIHVIRLEDEHIRIFNELDGASNTEFNTGSFMQTRSGEIYLGGVGGLTRFYPDSLHWPAEELPQAFIHSISIEGQGETQYLNYPHRDTLLRLLPDQRTLEFFFGSTDYFRPAGNTFYVQLSGLDRDWVPIGAVPHIKYYSLPAGRYTFRVRCGKDSGGSSPVEYAVSFEIETIFYKKWWFTALLAGLGLLLIWLGFRFQLYQIKREQDLRHRIAADLHDSLGAKLSSISNLVHVIGRLHRAGKSTTVELQRLLEVTQLAHGAMSDIIWAVDTSQKELSALIRRMEDYADKWVKSGNTKVKFEIVLRGSKRKIPFFLKHQLLLAYKETLGNALKHTFPEQITVRFETDSANAISIFVQNTFTERKPDAPSGGRGILGIEERMERIGGNVRIEEAENAFRVWLRVRP